MNEYRTVEKKIKETVESIPIPDGLELAIAKGIEAGRKERNKTMNVVHIPKKKSTPVLTRIAASIAMVIVILGAAGNLSPSFADVLTDIPVLGAIMKPLIFVNHEATGGEITDGIQLDDVTEVITENGSSIYIHFADNGDSIDLASAYEIVHTENPDVLSFSISGIRMMQMTEDFEVIKASDYVKDIYQVMTLDDSMVRFNIVLADNVDFEAFEHVSPAMLELRLTTRATEQTEETMYSVRSYSYPKSEGFAILEESLYHREIAYRIMKDEAGWFYYEFGRFYAEDKADAYLADFEEQLSVEMVPVSSHAAGAHMPIEVADESEPDVEVEEAITDDEVLENRFYVHMNNGTIDFDGWIAVGEVSMTLSNSADELLVIYDYDQLELSKASGEASYIFYIESESEQWTITGVYSDFFETLNTYLETPIE